MYSRALERRGPLAQLVEQGTFNPKVAGSTPSRPTIFSFQSRWQGLRLLHAVLNWAIVQRQDSGFWYQLSRFESWWPSHFTPLLFFTLNTLDLAGKMPILISLTERPPLKMRPTPSKPTRRLRIARVPGGPAPYADCAVPNRTPDMQAYSNQRFVGFLCPKNSLAQSTLYLVESIVAAYNDLL